LGFTVKRLWRQVLEGQLHPTTAETVLYQHVPQALDLQPPPRRPTAFERFASELTGQVPSGAELRRIRQQRWKLGRAKDHQRRLDLIDRAYAAYTSPWLVALLLAQAREAVHASPAAAGELAELADAVARRGEAARTPGARPLTLAFLGNALRADARLKEASPYFDQAREVLRREGGPGWVIAEVDSLHGSLLKDARRLDAAELCLANAARRFEQVGDDVGAARALIKLAERHWIAAEPVRARTVVEEALDHVHPIADARLNLFAHHNLSLYLCALDRAEDAARLFRLLAPAYESFDDRQTMIRRQWLGGVIARGLGEDKQAEAAFRAALMDLVEGGSSAFVAAFVALDLIALLFRQNRWAEVGRLAASLPSLFENQGIQTEATVALLFLHRSAARQQLNTGLLLEIRRFVERAQVDRSLHFVAPS